MDYNIAPIQNIPTVQDWKEKDIQTLQEIAFIHTLFDGMPLYMKYEAISESLKITKEEAEKYYRHFVSLSVDYQ